MKDLPQGPFDAIVIGSGIGSLTTAVLLAKLQHKRVLVLEQHFTIGGQTHAFKRRGRFEFDVGIHYIGDMGNGMGRRLFDYLTEGQLQWQPMPPEFQRYVYPDFEFSVPSNPREYKRRLIEMFPLERAAIEQYFTDLRSAVNWYGAAHLVDAMPPLARLPLRFAVRSAGRVACMTLGAYLDRHFRSPQLKALLASQWGDYGLPPSQAAFGMHALVEVHYWRGGWYPVGGANALPRRWCRSSNALAVRCWRRRRWTRSWSNGGLRWGCVATTPSSHICRRMNSARRWSFPVPAPM